MKSHLQNTFIGMIGTKMLLNIPRKRNAQATSWGAELSLDFPFVRKQTLRIALEWWRSAQLHRSHVKGTGYFIRLVKADKQVF